MFRRLLVTLEKLTSSELRLAATVLAVLAVSIGPAAWSEEHFDSNVQVHQAFAFLHGHMALDRPIMDAVERDGQYFSIFPPFPALVLVPFVALFGLGIKTLLLTPLLGALIASQTLRLALKNRLEYDAARWVALAFSLGTAVWLCIRYPMDTYFAHCCAVVCTLAALNEVFGRQRGLLLGFGVGFAALSRQFTALALPFFWLTLLLYPRDGRSRSVAFRSVLATLVGLAVSAGIYLLVNQARFGSPLDSGYSRLLESEWYAYRMQRWGNLNLIYLPSNLIRMFLSGFSIQFSDPGRMIPSMETSGTSLSFASPFLFLALNGRIREARAVNVVGWLCVAAICLAVLCHKSALGGWQVNAVRYSLDFLPLLFVFLIRALRDGGEQTLSVFKWLVVYGVALNFAAFVLVPGLHGALMHLPH